MTTDEAKIKKHDIEAEFTKLIAEYERLTGFSVDGIEVRKYDQYRMKQNPSSVKLIVSL